LAGCNVAGLLDKQLKFLTVTSIDKGLHLALHQEHLIKRLRRYSPYRLYREGIMTKKQLITYYGRNWIHHGTFNIEYSRVLTSEGNGVIHILLRGINFFPQDLLRGIWSDLHGGSYEVRIKDVPIGRKSVTGMSSYLACQYFAKQAKINQDTGEQEELYVRFSKSKNWIFNGSVKQWKNCLNMTKDVNRNILIPGLKGKTYNPVDLRLAIRLFDNKVRKAYNMEYFPILTKQDSLPVIDNEYCEKMLYFIKEQKRNLNNFGG